MLDAAKRFATMCLRGGVSAKPKLHLMMHSALRAFSEGTPAAHATWADETLNRLAASVGASAHRSVWELRVLESFNLVVRARAAPKRKRQ